MNLKYLENKGISKEEFIKICNESDSMAAATATLKLHRNTFTKYAKFLECYKPIENWFKKGYDNSNRNYREKIPLEDIIYKGLHPQYARCQLKKRIFDLKLKEHKCEICLLTEWNGLPIPIELDHIDGNTYNHLWNNLRLLCPNCHAQTDTYRGKNINNMAVC